MKKVFIHGGKLVAATILLFQCQPHTASSMLAFVGAMVLFDLCSQLQQFIAARE